MSPVPALMCALLLCGIPPHTTGLTDARPVPDSGMSPLPSGADAATDVAVLVSDEEAPDDRPSPITPPTSVPSTEPDATPTVPAEPGTTGAPGPEPSHEETPVVRYTVASPEPTTAVSGVLGHVSTGLLAVLGLLILGLRLSVGWPRFPEPYLGRRRRTSARQCG